MSALQAVKVEIMLQHDLLHEGRDGAGDESRGSHFAGASPGKAVSVQPIRGVERLNRITIGRREPVEEGLIKEGIKCAAYFAAPGQELLVDYDDVALRDGVALHNRLKDELKKLHVDLIPLMLVQVDSKDRSVERAKGRLLSLGFDEAQMAVHTADEPDSGLLALPNDEDTRATSL